MPDDILNFGERSCPRMPDDTLPWAVQKWLNHRDAVWVMDSTGPKEACGRCGPDPPCEGTIFRRKSMPWRARQQSLLNQPKVSESIDYEFHFVATNIFRNYFFQWH